MKQKSKFKIKYNSPVILTFTFICVTTLILNFITMGASNMLIFSVHGSFTDPFTYIRMFAHIFGHADVSHLTNNIMLLLLIGPMLEEKHGSRDLIFVIAVTAVVTGLVNLIIFPNTALLGASGVVFAFIIMSSITGIREHEIPLTFILVTLLYIGDQIITGIFVQDNISQITHIIGGLVGGILGYMGVPGNKK